MGYQGSMKSLKGGSPYVHAYNLKGIKENLSLNIFLFASLLLSLDQKLFTSLEEL